ncbi:hypothetical protein H8R18_00980 [Nanchangia anserum]|uniref:Uncharacterized protein n=1 Tax=Nanchangia anserum TaxID=2692125 RepID=A0A8I0GCV1_9ACTO|nr:hypothetical protein [Nanchangia anserum]MBD3689815.1 hypothetical protein [Nanchangia anserum]QOX81984.1 hypothetical protein H8R18_00980 [Nanchangia anserum]
MALFEFERGRLIPAQFGRSVDQGLGPGILESIRSQVLEVIGRPLFPVAWQAPESEIGPDGGPHCLTALDASGQVVSVEVLQRLDAVSLIAAMGRLGEATKMGWLELAHVYPGGPEAFRAGWAEFRESMPPTVEPGPRLFLVVGDVDQGVDSALTILAAASLEIHQVNVREMSNGRRFLEVHPLSLTTHSSRPQLGGHSAPAPQLEWYGDSSRETGASQPPAPAPAPAPVAISEEQSEGRKVAATQGAPLGRDRTGLLAIADVVGEPMALYARSADGRTVQATLTEDGRIDTGSGMYSDADQALSVFVDDPADGWSAWHIGHEHGPTLAEAIDEMNAIDRHDR